MQVKSIEVIGPPELLDAIYDEVPAFVKATGLFYYGIVMTTGSGSGNDGSRDRVTLHLRDKVDLEHALQISLLAVTAIAKARGMSQQATQIKLTYDGNPKTM